MMTAAPRRWILPALFLLVGCQENGATKRQSAIATDTTAASQVAKPSRGEASTARLVKSHVAPSAKGGSVGKATQAASHAPTAEGNKGQIHPMASAPKNTMRHAKALALVQRSRLGVVFGLPKGWRDDDPSWLVLYPRPRDGGARFAALRLSDEGLTPANRAQLLKRGLLPTELSKMSWGAWKKAKIGSRSWQAELAKGEGTTIRRSEGLYEAWAAVVEVPGSPAVGFVATWPKAKPGLEERVMDIVRHLNSCHVKVGMGCVPDPS